MDHHQSYPRYALIALGLLGLPAAARASEAPVPEFPEIEVAPLETARAMVPGAWKIAPEAVISFPQPLQLGLEVGHEALPSLRAFADAGLFQYPFFGGDRTFHENSVEMGLRWRPFQNWLTASVALGYRHIAFTADTSAFQLDGESAATSGTIDLSTVYASPTIGGCFQLTRRLSAGFDFGIQYPLFWWGAMSLVNTADGTTSANSSLLEVDSKAAMGRVASLIVPRVTLFRLSWAFE